MSTLARVRSAKIEIEHHFNLRLANRITDAQLIKRIGTSLDRARLMELTEAEKLSRRKADGYH